MPTLVRALVKPELLGWARTSARLDEEEAAKKVGVKRERLLSWESGESQPTIGQLRKLGRAYKRPLAVFYLSKPPKHFQAMQDFRRLPEGAAEGTQSPELAFEVRRAQYRREIALDLYGDLLGAPPAFPGTATLDEDPEVVGLRLRELLKVGRDEPATWKNNHEALNRWRAALEAQGVLVFQAIEVEVSEMRGFSISAAAFPVVVVNLKDAPLGRVFSMLHEATHLMLREGGLCDLEEPTSPAQRRVEVFCNHVAGATLMPRDWLLDEEAVRAQAGSEWPDETITALAHRYRASREAVVRRLLILGRTTEAFYRRKRQDLQAELKEQREKLAKQKALGLASKGFVTPAQKTLSTAGPFFVRLVLQSYHQENITSNDLSSFLEVRLKHIPKIEGAVLRRSVVGARA